MALTKATAAALLEKQRYDASILPQLEAYVDAQCKDGSHDLDANMACLKLYQFHPEQLKEPTVAKILAKALTSLPNTDYLACTYLIPERVLDAEPIAALNAAAGLLETCSFRAFWPALAPLRADLLNAVAGFDDAVRGFVLSVVERTYQSVPVSHLRESLGLGSDAEVGPLVQKRGWTVAGDQVKIALNDDNQAKAKVAAESETMSLDTMAKILAATAPRA